MEQLLHYMPAHNVLVCKQCSYAIQPSAISRHLKERHHVYREHRQKMLKYAEALNLAEPADVSLPLPGDAPLPFLTIESGFACATNGCSHLCVTLKRMKRHWATSHGRAAINEVDWQRVNLQTFFRGSHLRYFAVSIPSSEAALVAPRNFEEVKNYGHRSIQEDEEDSLDNTTPLQDNTTPSQDNTTPSQDNKTPSQGNATPFQDDTVPSPAVDFSLEDLELLHHFTLSTSLTLTLSRSLTFYHGSRPSDFWTKTVPQMAYGCGFLMRGLLAFAALHLAYLNPTAKDRYILIATGHQNLALPHFRTAAANANAENCHAVLVFSKLVLVQNCAIMQLNSQSLDKETSSHDRIVEFLRLMRGGCALMNTSWHMLTTGPIQALLPPPSLEIDLLRAIEHDCLNALCCSLLLLDTASTAREDEIKACRDAFLELQTAFSISLQSVSPSRKWDAVEYWPSRLSGLYLALISDRRPQALIIFAYYCILVKQISNHWFMECQAAQLLSSVTKSLGKDKHHLIQGPLEEVGVLQRE